MIEALRLIQHRGQDGVGVWHCRDTANGFATTHQRQTGRGDPDVVRHLPDTQHMVFLAHWRYATRGGSLIADVHPILVDGGEAALAHNGQFQLWERGRGRPLSDTRLFSMRIENETSLKLGDRVFAALDGVAGAFALVAADRFGLTTACDRFGIRPLFQARYPGGMAFSSETPALQHLKCDDIEEIKPGSVTDWTAVGPIEVRSLPPAPRSSCSFESIYFHTAGGLLRGSPVAALRHRLGQLLAREHPVDGDLVVPVPKSGIDFAQGFAEQLHRVPEHAISLTADAARTFIQEAASRADAIRRKYVLNTSAIAGRSVIIVDDSLVRGATMKHLASALRHAGASQVHARIGSPRFTHPCFFGIDVPDRKELICEGRSLAEVSSLLGLDSLAFLSLAGLHDALGSEICTGCFSGRYPEGALSYSWRPCDDRADRIIAAGETDVRSTVAVLRTSTTA
ncbi:amidophosphoribosyltransferase [Mesorhizobium sp. INR15]|uniref:amidophosphoribosyltransferase n=1 Tax=Mesorhizobium sp. INR15 TaxID=2654248 RepID=UPI0018969F2C|nr:phosphoribosyltransferase family protein [Mesorhizobium sp. INR15]